MVCETRRARGETPEERKRKVTKALAKLVQQLGLGTARLVIGRNGAVAITGWQERNDVADACAYRALSTNPTFRMALVRAEALAGRKVDERQVNAGTHSHDGGATWHGGHP